MNNDGFLNRLKKWIDGESMMIDADNYIKKSRDREKIKITDFFDFEQIRKNKKIYPVLCVMISLVFIMVMLMVVGTLPEFGNADNPAHNEVMERYIEQGIEETGVINFVTGMILDYRAFDTFAEANVLFLAVMSGFLLLKRDRAHVFKRDEEETEQDNMIAKAEQNVLLQVVAKYVCPLIVLYGIYIVLNGHLSPGGGFSGGAIIGGGFILYAAAFGHEKIQTFFTLSTFTKLSVGGLLVYFCCKCYSFFTGANHVGWSVPKGNVGDILSGGFILPLNICVGVVVACTVYGFYALFSRGDI